MLEQVLIARHEDNGLGLVLEKSLDCKTVVVGSNGFAVEPIDYDGINYVPCNVGDKIIVYYNKNKQTRTFKVVDVERSGHFFVCEIIYDEDELVELELISIAEQANEGNMSTNLAHLKADQLIASFLYKKGYIQIADAFNKVPKYYE
jgi:hypothetical protein